MRFVFENISELCREQNIDIDNMLEELLIDKDFYWKTSERESSYKKEQTMLAEIASYLGVPIYYLKNADLNFPNSCLELSINLGKEKNQTDFLKKIENQTLAKEINWNVEGYYTIKPYICNEDDVIKYVAYSATTGDYSMHIFKTISEYDEPASIDFIDVEEVSKCFIEIKTKDNCVELIEFEYGQIVIDKILDIINEIYSIRDYSKWHDSPECKTTISGKIIRKHVPKESSIVTELKEILYMELELLEKEINELGPEKTIEDICKEYNCTIEMYNILHSILPKAQASCVIFLLGKQFSNMRTIAKEFGYQKGTIKSAMRILRHEEYIINEDGKYYVNLERIYSEYNKHRVKGKI